MDGESACNKNHLSYKHGPESLTFWISQFTFYITVDCTQRLVFVLVLSVFCFPGITIMTCVERGLTFISVRYVSLFTLM